MSVYEDGRTRAMIGLDYSLIAEELGCSDLRGLIIKLLQLSLMCLFTFCTSFAICPTYKQITEGLTKLKGEMWVDVNIGITGCTTDNAQTKNQREQDEARSMDSRRLHPERYGNKTETVVKHELSQKERALKIAKLADMMRKKDEDKQQLRI